MNEIKQASMYLRVLWINDNENLRPDNINIKLDGEVVEEITFSITQNDNNVGNNSPWENVTEWANGITYNYQKNIENEENLDENNENSEIDSENNENIDIFPMVIPSVSNIPTNYRCNILKNAETEDYAYYTIKMTYVPSKRKLMARTDWIGGTPDNPSSTPTLKSNGTTIENAKLNKIDSEGNIIESIELDKVKFNDTIYFEKSTTQSFKDIILANSTLNEETPDFSLTATTDEGMFETNDPIYGEGAKSQYFRGAVTNNYVKFANFWWRIIRINGDGTVRMIYDGTSGHANGESTTDSIAVATAYNTSYNQSNYVGWTYEGQLQRPTDNDNATSCNAKTQIENWYNTNLSSYVDKISDGYYCNDRNVQSGTTWTINGSQFYYAAYKRIYTAHSPSLACSTSDIYTLKVGLITIDEAMYTGGKIGTSNNQYYLYNGQNYWTMSPYNWNGSNASVFIVNVNGYLNSVYVNGTSRGLHPVINLASDVQVTGTGTIDDPYVVVGAE